MNINNNSLKNDDKRGLVSKVVNNKWVYIFLVVFMSMVGVTAVLITVYNIKLTSEFDTRVDIPQNVSSDTISSTTSELAEANVSDNTSNNSVSKEDKKLEANAFAADSNTKMTGKVNIQKFIKPVFGDITLEFAQDRLVYSKTLNEWRTHSGVDFAAQLGTSVKAVADGIISSIKSDPCLGMTIIISHKDGIETVYSNLANSDMVSVNQKIKQGDNIGAVGDTAAFEKAEQSHIHFEVWKNKKIENPLIYFN